VNWFQKVLPNHEQPAFLDAAEQAFAAICQGDTFAADIYRVHPDIKEQDWKAIRENLVETGNTGDASELAQRLRGRLAVMVESLVNDHFYANLGETDRELFAKLLGSSREAEDGRRDVSTTHDFAYASVLEFVILNGWASEDVTVESLASLQQAFIEHCNAHCALELAFARAQAQGRQITEAEKEQAKATGLHKEAARRAFAGDTAIALTQAAEK
jgi:hypothetical protein